MPALFWFNLVVLFGPEIAGGFWQRSQAGDKRADYGSQRVIVWGVTASAFLGVWLHDNFRAAEMTPHNLRIMLAGTVLTLLGVAFRWYAILLLGRFFTRDVAIRPGHVIVKRGPYRWLRHPSYSGGLLGTLGFALVLNNWASLAVIMAVSLGSYAYRMQVEEAALVGAFGEDYVRYQSETKRLVPWVY
jgi:protein-S-isoprenylcysteine O-methyltransferase Ste14